MFHFFPSTFFNFEFARVLSVAPYQGSEIGECLSIVELVRDNDPESWYCAWSGLAEKAESEATKAQSIGDMEAARWAFIRSANYWRASEFMLHCRPDDPRILQLLKRSVANFRKGAVLLEGGVHFLEIPYESSSLPGYLYLPPPSKRLPGKIPILVISGGYDSTQEELYAFTAAGALSRGYAALTFEGPGQGICLRRDSSSIRPDWEVVAAAVLDHIFVFVRENPDVGMALDLERIAITGASLGGYLSLRAAADPRFAACVSVDGPYDLFDVIRTRTPAWFLRLWQKGYISDNVFNTIVDFLCKLNFQTRWEFAHGKWALGAPTTAHMVREFSKYSLKLPGDEQYLHRVKCPVLVTGAEDSLYFSPESDSRRIYDSLVNVDENRKMLWIGRGGIASGSMQAKVAAQALAHRQIFGWLDKQLGIQRTT